MNKKYSIIILVIIIAVAITTIGIIITNNKNPDSIEPNIDVTDEPYVTNSRIEAEKIKSGELETEYLEWSIPPEEDPFMEAPGSYKADDPNINTVGDLDVFKKSVEEYAKEEHEDIEEDDSKLNFYKDGDFEKAIENFEVTKIEGGIGREKKSFIMGTNDIDFSDQ